MAVGVGPGLRLALAEGRTAHDRHEQIVELVEGLLEALLLRALLVALHTRVFPRTAPSRPPAGFHGNASSDATPV